MVIGDNFVWAHFPKTGGDSTHELFRLIGITDGIDDTRRPDKHDSFLKRERETGLDLTHSRRRIVNIRRLPAWLLSHAKHQERNNGHPVDPERLRSGQIVPMQGIPRAQPIAGFVSRLVACGNHSRQQNIRRRIIRLLTTPGPARLAQSSLTRMMSDRVDHWIRQEHLVDDFLHVMSQLVEITPGQKAAVRAMQPRNTGDYERDLTQWFSREDMCRIYENNPAWAAVEREVYGYALIDMDADSNAA